MSSSSSSNDDLDAFLSQVEKISALVQDLKHDRNDAAQRADAYLAQQENVRVKSDRTIISKTQAPASAPESAPALAPAETMAPDAFLNQLQRDADERAQRREKNRAAAGPIKEAGNAAFTKGDFGAAESLYTEALQLYPDSLALYTNRAQARLRQSKFAEALSDCDWALRLHERHPKALMRKGLALRGLQRDDEAIEWLTKAVHALPASERAEVQRQLDETIALRDARERDRAAVMALTQLTGGNLAGNLPAEKVEVDTPTRTGIEAVLQHLPKLLEQVTAPAQLNQVQIENVDDSAVAGASSTREDGSRRLLERATAVIQCAEALPPHFARSAPFTLHLLRDVFRVQRGLLLLPCLQHFATCLVEAEDVRVTALIATAQCAVLDLLRCACSPADAETLWLQPNACHTAEALLKHPLPPVQGSLLQLLHSSLTSIDSKMRKTLGAKLPMSLVTALSVLALDPKQEAALRRTLLEILAHVADAEEFCQRESRFLEKSWLPSLVKGIEDSQIRTEAWTVLVQLSRDARLREIMSSTQTTETVVAATAKLLRNDQKDGKCLEQALALLTNIALGTNTVAILQQEKLAEAILNWLAATPKPSVTRARSVGLLARMATDVNTVTSMVDSGVVEAILPLLASKEPTEQDNAVRCLAKITKLSSSARQALHATNNVDVICSLLNKGGNVSDAVIGNAALCLAHLAEDGEMCTSWPLHTVDKLLQQAAVGDGSKQSNCAIALGRICMRSSIHLQRLRELDGLKALARHAGQ